MRVYVVCTVGIRRKLNNMRKQFSHLIRTERNANNVCIVEKWFDEFV